MRQHSVNYPYHHGLRLVSLYHLTLLSFTYVGSYISLGPPLHREEIEKLEKG